MIATLLANLVWALLYLLAYGAVSRTYVPEAFADGGDGACFWCPELFFSRLLPLPCATGTREWGSKYMSGYSGIVAGIVLCFMGVVLKISTSAEDFNLLGALSGFIPDLSILWQPAEVFLPILKDRTGGPTGILVGRDRKYPAYEDGGAA